ncbi:MAG: spore protease YyaC [Clostridium butyricum]
MCKDKFDNTDKTANKIKFHYKEDNKESIKQDIAKTILKKFMNSNKEELVVVNIGTDKCIGDAVAPLVGTLLERDKSTITHYGSCIEPIHALNIDSRLGEINKKHPNAFVIGVDACLGDKEDVGTIIYREKAIEPGRGIGKTLPHVGDCSIIGIVDNSESATFFSSKSIRLGFIMELSENIADIVKELNNENNLKFLKNLMEKSVVNA